MSIIDERRMIGWNTTLERYFVETGEKACGHSWLHKRAEERYSGATIYIDLPCIIIGAINGLISVGSKQIFPGDDYASIYIGVISLFVSLLNTINSYFSWNRRAEGHKISSLNYAKLYRFISIELSLPRNERMSAPDLLKYVKSEYDRLSEISPLIPPTIISQFRTHFSKISNISIPEDCNGLHAVRLYESSLSEAIEISPVSPRASDTS